MESTIGFSKRTRREEGGHDGAGRRGGKDSTLGLVSRIGLVVFALVCFCALMVDAQDAKAFAAQGDAAAKDNKFDDALEAYGKALKLSPNDYTLWYKRSNINFIRNRFDDSLDDLERALAINPEFVQGILRRGQIKLRFGRFQEARNDFEEVLRQKPTNSMADRLLKQVTTILTNDARGQEAMKKNEWAAAKDFFSLVLDESPDYIPGNVHRARCALELGDYHQVISDTLRVLKKQSSHATAICLRAKALLFLEEQDNSLKLFRDGARLDPDNEFCQQELKNLLLYQQSLANGEALLTQNKPSEAIEEFRKALPIYPTILNFVKHVRWRLCFATNKLKDAKKTLDACQAVLDLDEGHFDAVMTMGEASLSAEDYEGAVRYFRKAAELQPQNGHARQSLQRAEKLLKMAQRKDYYKILGVPKDANVQMIKKSYRKLALEWHPDKHSGDEEVAKIKFTEINEAYEVLGDEEKRRKYDNGDDIQPEGHQGHGFHGFHGGGGGPFNFHFQWGG